jgi:hypothetical protein
LKKSEARAIGQDESLCSSRYVQSEKAMTASEGIVPLPRVESPTWCWHELLRGAGLDQQYLVAVEREPFRVGDDVNVKVLRAFERY